MHVTYSMFTRMVHNLNAWSHHVNCHDDKHRGLDVGLIPVTLP